MFNECVVTYKCVLFEVLLLTYGNFLAHLLIVLIIERICGITESFERGKGKKISNSAIYRSALLCVFHFCFFIWLFYQSLEKFVLSLFSGPDSVVSSSKLGVTKTEIAPAFMECTIQIG